MAEKRYTAVFSAKDHFSPAVRQMQQTLAKAKNEQELFIKKINEMDKEQKEYIQTTKRTTESVDRMKRALVGVGSGFATMGNRGMTAVRTLGGGLKSIVSTITSLPALIAGAGTAFGAWKLTDAIVGGAMTKELTQMQMGALLADKGKGNDLFKMVQDKAMTSMFSEKDFAAAATTFLPVTKDFDQLNRLMSVNERLAASNPLEGMSGASFSMREALSGDIMSIADRFNISKKTLRESGFDSNASWQQNLEAVDKTLNKMGYTADYVSEVNDSAYAQWELFKSNGLKLFADSGEGILSKLKEPLKQLNLVLGSEKMTAFVDRFGDFLATKFASGVDYIQDMNLTWGDFERLLKGAGGIFSGVGDSFAIMMGTFTGEKGNSPRDAFEQFAKTLEDGGNAIDRFNESFSPFVDNLRAFADFGTTFFGKNDDGTRDKGLLTRFADGVTGKGWDKTYDPSTQVTPWQALKETFRINGQLLDGIQFNPNAGSSGRLRGSHRAGLSYVPYDGYVAELHKGEQVVPAQAAQRMNGQVVINISQMQVRNESDIDAIGKAIANELRLKGAI